jgi:HEAT repeat protein
VSTNVDIAIVVAFVVGLLLYGIGTSMLRSQRAQNGARKGVTWPRLVDESLTDADPQLRADIVERLGIIGEPWCADILRQAIEQEDDAGVRSAITAALKQPS